MRGIMKLFYAREQDRGERRIPIVPQTVGRMKELKAEVLVETGMGERLGIPDAAYVEAGAEMVDSREGLGGADMVLRLRPPSLEAVEAMRPGTLHVSFLDPFSQLDLVRALAAGSISAFSLELIPRSTIAQKMDAISSQSNLGGYVAVILAAGRIAKIFPMMSTPAGSIAPSRVLVIGAGVAGLQAIATAKRLGAVVEAFDTRPVVEEQVKSLGARFVKIDLGETGQTEGGYAKALTGEQLQRQQGALARHCAAADVVITTAQVFGRKAPVIVTRAMVEGMSPGSVLVDMAVESGGNVEGSKLDEEVEVNGVRILGMANLPGRVAVHASQMFSGNLYSFVEHFWDEDKALFAMDTENEIIKGCLVTHGGEVVNPLVRDRLEDGKEV